MKPRGGKRKFQTLTTASDTLTTLNPTYRNDLRLTGTGVMQVYDLGDARQYNLDTAYYIFYNNTPEFVGVVNSDGTVWHRVPPRARCICTLLDQTTAAGVWWSIVDDPAVNDPRYGYNKFSDQVGPLPTGVYYGDEGYTTVANGTAAGVNSANIFNALGGRQGGARFYAGTTAAGYALGYQPASASNYTHLGSGARAMEASVGFVLISTAADEYIGRIGLGNNITGGAHTEGCYFIYDRLGSGVNWRFNTVKTAGGAANTTVNTGVAPLYSATYDAYQRLRCEIDSSGARADAFIDRVQVTAAGGVGTLPAITTTLSIFTAGITGSAYNAAARIMHFDYKKIQSYPTALR